MSKIEFARSEEFARVLSGLELHIFIPVEGLKKYQEAGKQSGFDVQVITEEGQFMFLPVCEKMAPEERVTRKGALGIKITKPDIPRVGDYSLFWQVIEMIELNETIELKKKQLKVSKGDPF